MTIYDLFSVNDEIDMVTARMAALAEVPDVLHMAVEANITHQGTPKPWHLREYYASRDTVPKRLLVIGAELEPNAVAYEVEKAQRDGLLLNLRMLAAPDADDLILSCDADEIIRAEAIPAILEATAKHPSVLLEMRHHWYSTDWYDPAGWRKARAFRWEHRPESLSDVRWYEDAPVIADAGWHLSWFGGPERIHAKLRSFHHVEYNTDEVHDRVERCLAEGVALTGLHLTRWDGGDLPPYA